MAYDLFQILHNEFGEEVQILKYFVFQNGIFKFLLIRLEKKKQQICYVVHKILGPSCDLYERFVAAKIGTDG